MIKQYNLKKQKGFTLVEMLVVIVIMSIMLGLTAWGVTGWIQHFTYIKSEETARHIYLGAQSGLSAHEGRGTLDELFKEIENNTNGNVEYVDSSDDDIAEYGLPTEPDIKGVYHKYAILKCKSKAAGEGIDSNTDSALYRLVRPYMADTESLEGSIALELDMTAKKVYAVFYSPWAKEFKYGEDAREIRGNFGVVKDTREPDMRTEYCVGYYGSNQVNVANLKNSLTPVNVEYAELFNDETLHLDFRSDAGMIETNTSYRIDFYQKSSIAPENDKKLFSISLDPSAVFDNHPLLSLNESEKEAQYSALDDHKISSLKQLKVTDSAFNVNGNYWFYVDYKKQDGDPDDAATGWNLSLMLDCQADSATLAHPDQPLIEKDDIVVDPLPQGATPDKIKLNQDETMSITRLIGDNPRLIYAKVYAGPNANGNAFYSAGTTPLTTQPQNDLLATDRDVNDVAVLTPGDYTIVEPRHFSNIRYAERYKLENTTNATYAYHLAEDLYWENAKVFSLYAFQSGGANVSGFLTDDAGSDVKKTFATIPKLSTGSILDGAGHAIYDLAMDNTSYVEYADSLHTENVAQQIGIFGESYGTIQRLVLRKASMSLLSNAEKTQIVRTESKNGTQTVNKTVFGDNIHAAGILCGRDYGNMQEIYLDDECSMKATVFQMDEDEIAKEKGCGIGLLAGCVHLEKANPSLGKSKQVHDRLRTGGELKASFGMVKDTEENDISSVKEVEQDLSKPQRSTIFTGDDNRKQYAYGVGGLFGYIYGDFSDVADLKDQPQIGLDKDAIQAKGQPANPNAQANQASNPCEKYAEEPISLKKSKLSGTFANEAARIEIANVFDNWTWSIENHARINRNERTTNAVFVGGIVGSAQFALNNTAKGAVEAGDHKKKDEDNDPAIPTETELFMPQLLNIKNYGSVCGSDFVGGIVGANSPEGYITDCISYCDLTAVKGISGGICAENYGFVEKCSVDGDVADTIETDGYAPIITGNRHVAGTVVSINRKDAVLKNCYCAKEDSAKSGLSDTNRIGIIGNDMMIMGYLAGENYGIVNGGSIGKYVGYATLRDSILIGGIVGVNYQTGVVKNIESAMDLKLTNAEVVGGVVAKNHGQVRNCIFSGKINQDVNGRNTKWLRIGGIVAVNEKEEGQTAGNVPTLQNDYLVGAEIKGTGVAAYTVEAAETSKLNNSSAIGGICGRNGKDCMIRECYVTAHHKTDANGQFVKNGNKYVFEKSGQSTLTVKNGMAGGIAAVNEGTIFHCGYSDKKILLWEDGVKQLAATAPGSNLDIENVIGVKTATGEDMAFADESFKYLELSTGDETTHDQYFDANHVTERENWKTQRNTLKSNLPFADTSVSVANQSAEEVKAAAAEALRRKYMRGMTADLNAEAQSHCGFLTDNEADGYNALPKEVTPHAPAVYDDSQNEYLVSLQRGKGDVGGIAGYNAGSGTIEYCSTGRWVVEYYLPTEPYGAIGGIAGENASRSKGDGADGDGNFMYNANLAYVRREMPYIVHKKISSSSLEERKKHAFSYIGGVIGTQRNESVNDWTIKGLLNAGKVVYMYGNNVAGIVCKLMKNGGTLEHCYNYGILMTGFSDNENGIGGYIGTAGGIVAHMTELTTDQNVNILSCQNHSIVNLQAIGMNRYTHEGTDWRARYLANDVGGIAGQLSSPKNDRYYSLNIRDCVNGFGAEVYTHSCLGGILGRAGGLSSYNESKDIAEKVDHVVINIEGCRNYSYSFYQFDDNSTAGNGVTTMDSMKQRVGSIFSSRPNYVNTTGAAGYTSIQNCLGVRMADFTNSGKDYSDTYGKISAVQNATDSLDLCVNNFYIDNYSFHYPLDRLAHDTSRWTFTQALSPLSSGNAIGKISALVGREEPSWFVGLINGVTNSVRYGTTADARLAGPDLSVIKPTRIYAVSVGDDNHHAMVVEDNNYSLTSTDRRNSWRKENEPGDGRDVLYGKLSATSNIRIATVVAYFSELGVSYSPYSLNYTNPIAFKNKFVKGEVTKSRTTYADEFDFYDNTGENYFSLDRGFVNHINWIKANQNYDQPYDVNVEEDEDGSLYKASWKVKATNPSGKPTATEYDMYVKFYCVYDGDTFNPNNPPAEPVLEEHKIVSGRTTTFTVPENLFSLKNNENDSDERQRSYYAVVRVKDHRAPDGVGLSPISDETDIKSYTKIREKLPQPEFKIVAYGDNWYLRLENTEAFKKYVDSIKEKNNTAHTNIDLNIGAYRMDKNGNKIESTDIHLTMDDLLFEDKLNTMSIEEIPILYNAVEISTENLATGVKDQEIYVYASSPEYLSSDEKMITAYVPKVCRPNMQFTWTKPTEEQKQSFKTQAPAYEGTLTYSYYDPSLTPPEGLEQKFLLELYGIKKDSENGPEYHETLYVKDYDLAPGEEKQISIGAYMLDNQNLLKEYTSFGVDCWYASPGQGDVYNYFETYSKKAEKKKRLSGYITDRTGSERKYYYRSVVLETPQVEIVRLQRNGNWYVRLLNPEDYEEIDGVTVNFLIGNNSNDSDNTSYEFSANTKITDGLASVLPYGRVIDGSDGTILNNSESAFKYAYAYADGFIRSGYFYYDDLAKRTTNSDHVRLKVGLNGWETWGNIYQMQNEKLTISGDEKLHYEGDLWASAHSPATDAQYYTVELTAKDEQEKEVTLYLDVDRLFEKGSNPSNTAYPVNQGKVEINVASDPAIGLDLKDYHDFQVHIWWSAMNFPSRSTKRYLRDWFVTTPEIAAKNNTRSGGIIKFVGGTYKIAGQSVTEKGTPDKPLYLFSAALSDAAAFKGAIRNSINKNTTNNSLYLISDMIVAKVTNAVRSEEDGVSKLTYSTTLSSTDHKYRIRKTWYRTSKLMDFELSEQGALMIGGTNVDEAITDTNKSVSVGDEEIGLVGRQTPADVAKGDGVILIGAPSASEYDPTYAAQFTADPPAGYTEGTPMFDEKKYDYFEVIDIVDANISPAEVGADYVPLSVLKAFGKRTVIKLTPDLPMPDVSIHGTVSGNDLYANGEDGYVWYLQLNNPEDYYVDGDLSKAPIDDNIVIECKLYGETYTIKVSDPKKVDLSGSGDASDRTYLTYISEQPVAVSDGQVTEMICQAVSDKCSGPESKRPESTQDVYIPTNGAETETNAAIELPDDACAIIDMDQQTITVSGNMIYRSEDTEKTSPVQRFRIALVDESQSPRQVLVSTKDDEDIMVTLNATDVVDLTRTLQLPAGMTEEEIRNLKLYVFYLDNDWNSNAVTHYTLLHDVVPGSVAKPTIFLDKTTEGEEAYYISRALAGPSDPSDEESPPENGGLRKLIPWYVSE
ncbi:MAG: prepilin-type N-terminal cleavage/methylation domain-containing protein [Lachnospiraceae bacterium]|nr:prepilin-type N-terminal cleavage/methylation domain-containing protein [Lachnospiraceae bacterium]